MWKNLFGFARTLPSQRQRAPFRPAVEELETRQCPSATVGLVGNTLNITGDNSNDTVKVFLRDNVNDIQVMSNPIVLNLGMYSRTIWHVDHFNSAQVQNININLQGGDDNLTVEEGLDSDASAVLFNPKNISINLGDGANQALLLFGGLEVPNRVISTNLNINVIGGAGADDVTAHFGRVQSGAVNYSAFLGGGDDSGFAGVWGNIDTGASLKIDLEGQDGNDNLYTFETYNGNYDQVNIAAGALLDINVNGGAGNDTMNMTYGGTVLGKLRIRQDGGSGNDSISGDLHLQPGSTGAVDAVYSGDDGWDGLRMEVYGSASAQRALIDGGTGWDRATSVGDVQIINANEFPVVVAPTAGTLRQS
ncbi:MAG TPA: hypothetical protein VN688_13465 [Gemmataceae bacterium]|nr:hypothetical protein [Gemmataceae bacterium]